MEHILTETVTCLYKGYISHSGRFTDVVFNKEKMAISRKNKYRVLVDGKEYLWWLFDETDQTEFDGIQIKAVCSDQTHFFKYGLQQLETDRKLVLALNNYAKLVHLASPPKFENDEGIITRSGIVRMIKWSKREDHKIQYAVDFINNKMNNNLNIDEQKSLLIELQEKIY